VSTFSWASLLASIAREILEPDSQILDRVYLRAFGEVRHTSHPSPPVQMPQPVEATAEDLAANQNPTHDHKQPDGPKAGIRET